jgi:hypothetical protein
VLLLTGGIQLDGHSDFPDEAKKFTGQGRYHLLLDFPSTQESEIAPMQAVLCLPGDFLHLRTDILLSYCQRWTDSRAMPISPCRLNYNASEVGVAGLGYPTTMRFFSA